MRRATEFVRTIPRRFPEDESVGRRRRHASATTRSRRCRCRREGASNTGELADCASPCARPAGARCRGAARRPRRRRRHLGSRAWRAPRSFARAAAARSRSRCRSFPSPRRAARRRAPRASHVVWARHEYTRRLLTHSDRGARHLERVLSRVGETYNIRRLLEGIESHSRHVARPVDQHHPTPHTSSEL